MVRPLDVLLVGRVPLPLERAPLGRAPLECDPFPFPLPACVPFILAPAAAFGFQRVAEAGLEPFAVRLPEVREAEVRTSALARRTGRFPVAGLRSRECVAGRLKCGRAATGFPFETGLRAGTGRAVCTSAAFCGSTGVGGAVKTAFGASTSASSSSCSRERRK